MTRATGQGCYVFKWVPDSLPARSRQRGREKGMPELPILGEPADVQFPSKVGATGRNEYAWVASGLFLYIIESVLPFGRI
jgi:hypothetical protein